MKKVILVLIFVIIGLGIALYKINNPNIGETNYLWLLAVLLCIVFAIPSVFPSLKKYKIGTLDFYPNLFKSIFKK